MSCGLLACARMENTGEHVPYFMKWKSYILNTHRWYEKHRMNFSSHILSYHVRIWQVYKGDLILLWCEVYEVSFWFSSTTFFISCQICHSLRAPPSQQLFSNLWLHVSADSNNILSMSDGDTYSLCSEFDFLFELFLSFQFLWQQLLKLHQSH